jgi:hypothetical protein
VIGINEINASINAINPHVGATNAMREAFGEEEALEQRKHLCREIGVDYEALMALGNTSLEVTAEQGRHEAPADYANGMVQGFLHGVLAARAEQDV